MDLSLTPFDRDQELIAWPGDLATLMIGVAARQGASPTAAAQAALSAPETETGSGSEPADATPPPGPFAPADGAFNGAVAAALTGWKDP